MSRGFGVEGQVRPEYDILKIPLDKATLADGTEVTWVEPGQTVMLHSTASLEPSRMLIHATPHPLLTLHGFTSCPTVFDPEWRGPVEFLFRAESRFDVSMLSYIVKLYKGEEIRNERK
jgi:deoxycytidine triphosphate deaminase